MPATARPTSRHRCGRCACLTPVCRPRPSAHPRPGRIPRLCPRSPRCCAHRRPRKPGRLPRLGWTARLRLRAPGKGLPAPGMPLPSRGCALPAPLQPAVPAHMPTAKTHTAAGRRVRLALTSACHHHRCPCQHSSPRVRRPGTACMGRRSTLPRRHPGPALPPASS